MYQTNNNQENLYTLEQQVQNLTIQVENLTTLLNTLQSAQVKEWMNVKEACSYMGVAYNTFAKYRNLGLQICEVEGVKRVSKNDIDEFLIKNKF